MKPISGAKKFGESCIRIFNVIFIQFYEKLHYSKKNNNDHLDQDMRMVKTVAVSVDNFFFFKDRSHTLSFYVNNCFLF